MLRYLLTQFSPTLLITTVILATYLLQQSSSPLLFLPAGVQIIAGFTYGLRSLVGCIIGMGLGMALLAHQPLGIEPLVISAAYGMLSTLCLLSFIHLVCRFGHVNHELVGLSYKHILVAVMLQATADAALRTWLIPAVEHPHTNPAILFQWLSLASGNLLGSMSVVLSIFLLTALPRKNA